VKSIVSRRGLADLISIPFKDREVGAADKDGPKMDKALCVWPSDKVARENAMYSLHLLLHYPHLCLTCAWQLMEHEIQVVGPSSVINQFIDVPRVCFNELFRTERM
jgi:hypothetical protein